MRLCHVMAVRVALYPRLWRGGGGSIQFFCSTQGFLGVYGTYAGAIGIRPPQKTRDKARVMYDTLSIRITSCVLPLILDLSTLLNSNSKLKLF